MFRRNISPPFSGSKKQVQQTSKQAGGFLAEPISSTLKMEAIYSSGLCGGGGTPVASENRNA
jgi:hypothetical protein